MLNLFTKYRKILEICKQYSKKIVDELVNTIGKGAVLKFPHTEVIALLLAAEAMNIDGENCILTCWLNQVSQCLVLQMRNQNNF